MKPTEQYPKDKIAEIDKLLKAEAAAKAAAEAEKAKEAKYQSLIAAGDKSFGSKDYTGARASYQSASGMKPTEQYPKDKIAEIDKLLKTEAAARAEKEERERYNKLIAKADKEFDSNDFNGAKRDYILSLKLYPNESYPKNRITEIDKKLKELQQVNVSVDQNNDRENPKDSLGIQTIGTGASDDVGVKSIPKSRKRRTMATF